MVLSDATYDLPLNNAWTDVWMGSYYNLSAATEGIDTPIDLSGVTEFSFFATAKFEDLALTTEPLFSFGGNAMWFRLNKAGRGALDVRLRDADNNYYDFKNRYKFDGNIPTRIHIDEVEGLGAFFELEVVLENAEDQQLATQEAIELMANLEISEADLIRVAYIDLILEQENRQQ